MLIVSDAEELIVFVNHVAVFVTNDLAYIYILQPM